MNWNLEVVLRFDVVLLGLSASQLSPLPLPILLTPSFLNFTAYSDPIMADSLIVRGVFRGR